MFAIVGCVTSYRPRLANTVGLVVPSYVLEIGAVIEHLIKLPCIFSIFTQTQKPFTEVSNYSSHRLC
jgi:hypothetical protein